MKMSRIETAMRVTIKYFEAFNRRDAAGMVLLMSDDCIFEFNEPAPDGVACSGKEAITQFWQEFFLKSPHAYIKLEEVFGLGTRCVARWRYNWVDLAGNEQHVRGVDIFQVKNGLICETFSYIKG